MSMNGEFLISKRYAQAFLNLFTLERSVLDKLQKTIEFLDQHQSVFSLLKVPLLEARIKKEALEYYLVKRFDLPDSFKKLIELLVIQKRTYLIDDVLRNIKLLYQDQQGIETFTISTSIPLEGHDLEIIQKFLAVHTHHTIICKTIIDKQLIAGMKMQSANHLWEYSVRQQLANIPVRND